MEEAPKSLVVDGTEVAGGNYKLPGRHAIEQKYLEATLSDMPGETPRVVFRGKTGMAVWWNVVPPWLLFWFIWALITRARLVVVTDRRIHLFRPGSVRAKAHVTKLVTLDKPVEVRLTRSGLKLGSERKVYALFGSFGAMRAAAAEAAQQPG